MSHTDARYRFEEISPIHCTVSVWVTVHSTVHSTLYLYSLNHTVLYTPHSSYKFSSHRYTVHEICQSDSHRTVHFTLHTYSLLDLISLSHIVHSTLYFDGLSHIGSILYCVSWSPTVLYRVLCHSELYCNVQCTI